MRIKKIVGLLMVSLVVLAFQNDDLSNSTKYKEKLFTINIPSYMYKMDDLNSEAELQTGYVSRKGDEVHEVYAIVLLETKKEIKSYELETEFDAKSYWDIAVNSLASGLDEYSVDTKYPVTENYKGMTRVVSEMHGKLGEVLVSYKLGVYEGKKAFYQVLTWTVTSQLEMFQDDMNMILNNFIGK